MRIKLFQLLTVFMFLFVFNVSVVSAENTAVKPEIIPSFKDDSPDFEPTKHTIELYSSEKKIVPVEMKSAGVLVLEIMDMEEYDFEQFYVEVYSDEELTDLKFQENFSEFKKNENIPINLTKKGIYYFVFNLLRSEYTEEIVELKTTYVGIYNNKTIKNEQFNVVYQDKSTQEFTYKIAVPRDGMIKFALSSVEGIKDFNAEVKLLDKDKKEISNVDYINSMYSEKDQYPYAFKIYTVKKGTYYISVKSDMGYGMLHYIFEETQDTSGTSIKKASTIKRDSTVVGYIDATDKKNTTDWYKFKSTKVQTFKVDITSFIDNKLDFVIVDGKGNTIPSGNLIRPNGSKQYTFNLTLYKGVYYIKVVKSATKSSGAYSIKFN